MVTSEEHIVKVVLIVMVSSTEGILAGIAAATVFQNYREVQHWYDNFRLKRESHLDAQYSKIP